MGKITGISWTDHTFNAWEGCTKVSPGCLNCYAETRNARFGGGTAPNWGKGAPRRLTREHNRNEPIRWNRVAAEGHFVEVTREGKFVARGDARDLARLKKGESPDAPWRIQDGDRVVKVRPRVFSASLSDWLDDEVPIDWLAGLLNTVRITPNLDWQLLTKRPEKWLERMLAVEELVFDHTKHPESELWTWVNNWIHGRPPANVWVGTTVEDQTRADIRVPQLLAIPAKVRFLSCEPLLGPVELNCADVHFGFPSHITSEGRAIGGARGIHWVIVGGESGPGARPMHPEWARTLVKQCVLSDIPVLVKQWGEWAPATEKDNVVTIVCEHSKCPQNPEWHTFPDGQLMGRVGKFAAGHELDGREWHQFPDAR